MFDRDITIICPDCDYFIYCNSSSMSPTFDCNDTLIGYPPLIRKDIKIGDIIWFKTKEGDIVHRVIGTDYKACYITKGDNNLIPDNYTPCFYDIKFKIVGVIYN